MQFQVETVNLTAYRFKIVGGGGAEALERYGATVTGLVNGGPLAGTELREVPLTPDELSALYAWLDGIEKRVSGEFVEYHHTPEQTDAGA